MILRMLAQELPGQPRALTGAQQHSVIFWCVVIILVTSGGFGLIAYVRRYMLSRAREAKYDTGFSLSDLRAMRDRGEITPEEYEQTRARVISKVKGRARQEEQRKLEEAAGESELSPDEGGDDLPESGNSSEK